MQYKKDKGTTILRRGTDYKPPQSWRTVMIGRPLSTADAPHQTIGKVIGLAVFASDALSSTAYSTQEMMIILIAAGMGAFSYVVPLSLGIVVLLTILTMSYEQTIHAYPNGGGAYIVARDNLGEFPALAAGAALLTDYVLTVAVSISSGVAQITSALPDLFPYRVIISVVLVFLVMLINLRGVKESGITFAVPTYFFIVMMIITVIVGLVKLLTGSLGVVLDPPELEMIHSAQSVTLFLILKAFASGTSAVTGVEAISNGITAFKEPRSKNAGLTLIMMSVILGSLLMGIATLATHVQAVPSEFETVVSQIVRTVYDSRGILYLMTITATTVILIMAANTAFADFPRLGALVAADTFLPRQLAYRGSRLVYSRGIIALAVIASGLIAAFNASVTALIPLYAIGVFASFTLSQGGMARRWHKIGQLKPGEELKERGSTLLYEKNWAVKMIINAFGAVTTLVVMVVFAVTKFADGAWIVIIILPVMMYVFLSIHRHYAKLARRLSLEDYVPSTRISRNRVIITLGGVHRGSLLALRYARTLSDDITAVHVSIDPDETEKIQKKWEVWGEGIRLVIIDSPYRLYIEPLMEYIDDINSRREKNEVITIVVPQFVSRHMISNVLHSRTADLLRHFFIYQKEIVITEVSYDID